MLDRLSLLGLQVQRAFANVVGRHDVATQTRVGLCNAVSTQCNFAVKISPQKQREFLRGSNPSNQVSLLGLALGADGKRVEHAQR
jgi:hypothetical protein